MEEGEPTSFADLFKIQSLRKRCVVGFLALFGVQGTATPVNNNYGPYLYDSLGFRTVQQLVIHGGWISVCPFETHFNVLIVDKFGRCKLLIWGFAGRVVALIGECITVSQFYGRKNIHLRCRYLSDSIARETPCSLSLRPLRGDHDLPAGCSDSFCCDQLQLLHRLRCIDLRDDLDCLILSRKGNWLHGRQTKLFKREKRD